MSEISPPESGSAVENTNDEEALPSAFRALLCCPVCSERPPLRFVAATTTATGASEGARLICDRCGRVYPITDGFPDLRPQENTTTAKPENGV